MRGPRIQPTQPQAFPVGDSAPPATAEVVQKASIPRLSETAEGLLAGISRRIWVEAWAQTMEGRRSFSGLNIEREAPPTPLAFQQEGRRWAAELVASNLSAGGESIVRGRFSCPEAYRETVGALLEDDSALSQGLETLFEKGCRVYGFDAASDASRQAPRYGWYAAASMSGAGDGWLDDCLDLGACERYRSVVHPHKDVPLLGPNDLDADGYYRPQVSEVGPGRLVCLSEANTQRGISLLLTPGSQLSGEIALLPMDPNKAFAALFEDHCSSGWIILGPPEVGAHALAVAKNSFRTARGELRAAPGAVHYAYLGRPETMVLALREGRTVPLAGRDVVPFSSRWLSPAELDVDAPWDNCSYSLQAGELWYSMDDGEIGPVDCEDEDQRRLAEGVERWLWEHSEPILAGADAKNRLGAAADFLADRLARTMGRQVGPDVASRMLARNILVGWAEGYPAVKDCPLPVQAKRMVQASQASGGKGLDEALAREFCRVLSSAEWGGAISPSDILRVRDAVRLVHEQGQTRLF